ncbi:MAG: iron chaperone [Candidatus Saccharimonadales bacterium]
MPTSNKKDMGEAEVLEAIAAMPEPDRNMGEKLHDIIKSNAPELLPRTWYGMPAYSDGNKIVVWFRSRKKFGERYMTIGFNDVAKLDDGNFWPVNYALTELKPAEESKIAELIKKAVNG